MGGRWFWCLDGWVPGPDYPPPPPPPGILYQPSSVSIHNAKLYMSGLPKEMGQDMEQLFSQYSRIITSHIVINQVTYVPRCLDPHPRGGGLPRCLGPQ